MFLGGISEDIDPAIRGLDYESIMIDALLEFLEGNFRKTI